MIENATQIGVGGILALLILREVFTFVGRLRDKSSAGSETPSKTRPRTDPIRAVHMNVEAVLSRLDRIVERLEDLADETKNSRRQSEITSEQTERMVRAVGQLESTINDLTAKRRSGDTNPGL